MSSVVAASAFVSPSQHQPDPPAVGTAPMTKMIHNRGVPLSVPSWADAIKSDPLCCALSGDVPLPGTPCWNDTEPMPAGRPAFKLPARKNPSTGEWVGLGCFCHPACALRWAHHHYPKSLFETLCSRVATIVGKPVQMAPDPFFTLRKFCTPPGETPDADYPDHRHQHAGADERAGFDVCTPNPGMDVEEYRSLADQNISFQSASACVRAGHVVVFRSVAKPETIADLARRGVVAGPAPRGDPAPGSLVFALNKIRQQEEDQQQQQQQLPPSSEPQADSGAPPAAASSVVERAVPSTVVAECPNQTAPVVETTATPDHLSPQHDPNQQSAEAEPASSGKKRKKTASQQEKPSQAPRPKKGKVAAAKTTKSNHKKTPTNGGKP